jgi:predicted AAA+ superfamily ATPase
VEFGANNIRNQLLQIEQSASAQVFEKFVTAQHVGLITCYEQLSRNAWNKAVEVYMNDLRLQNQDDLLDLEKLRNAYSDAIQPLVSLATNQGFKLWQSSYIA